METTGKTASLLRTYSKAGTWYSKLGKQFEGNPPTSRNKIFFLKNRWQTAWMVIVGEVSMVGDGYLG